MTTMNTCSLLLVAVATAVVSVVCSFAPLPSPATTDPDPDPYPCPWRTVAHPDDPFIQNLGSWAVDQLHIVMRFNKVDSAKLQGVGQCTSLTRNYYYELIIDSSLRGSGSSSGDDYRN
ncbi:unnamed protein product [Miscanthus lutarioriparius]|uniref:Uncharacterized protein n=1 Tax=Miscanthus lutarioriparius TaxID=422564 RepID=A0A811REG9_9POAL|nr:unnamed protein product [Miscanthus lutarioriparius]